MGSEKIKQVKPKCKNGLSIQRFEYHVDSQGVVYGFKIYLCLFFHPKPKDLSFVSRNFEEN
jgi:hypothetical protein